MPKDAARKPLRVLFNGSSHVGDAHPEAAWNDIRKAVETAVREQHKRSNSRQLFRLVTETGIRNPIFNWPSVLRLYEVEKAIGNLKQVRAAGPDRFTPEIFKYGELDAIPSDWSQSLIVPVYKKGKKVLFLTNIAGFRLGRGCIDQIFTLRQILEHRHTFRRSTIVVFLDLTAEFDSVDREVLWQCLSLKGVSKKYINLVKALYSNTTGRVRAYGELSSELITLPGKSIDDAVKLHQLRWLGHVLRMPNHRLPRPTT
ncbi:uncharacterized protein DC041_0000146 [Schistosoma bovis]|uniref:Uncharacterized protein n=1 Tax=Schistosoma bovis TaxID=6184 RepID=A0A430Q2H5_SCHBO|nr:uncharacterized protein DC041_0000146 [Schistosoma bovis]